MVDKAEQYKDLPRSRDEAKAAGVKRYFSGVPCKHGHIDFRYAGDGACAECSRVNALRRYYENWEKNKEAARARLNKRYAEDPIYREAAKAKQKTPEILVKKRAASQIRRDNLTEEDRFKARNYMREYARKRHQGSPKARLNRSISGGIYKSIKDGAKDGRGWESLVGYTVSELMAHLEKQFLPGMSWDNYGKWHIDHRIPKTAFNYETPDDMDFKKCWELSNLGPLWARDNISKGKKLTRPFQPSLLITVNNYLPTQGTTHG